MPPQNRQLLDLNFFTLLAIILPSIYICFTYQQNILHPTHPTLNNTTILTNPPTWLLYSTLPALFISLYKLSNRGRTPTQSQHLALQSSTMAVFLVANLKGDSFQTMWLMYFPSVWLVALVLNEMWLGGVEVKENTA